MIIDASLLRAQQMRVRQSAEEPVPVEVAFLCICCKGVFDEDIGRCPKDGRNVLPFARLALPVIGEGQVFYAMDPTLPIDAVGFLELPDEVYESQKTEEFRSGLDPSQEAWPARIQFK